MIAEGSTAYEFDLATTQDFVLIYSEAVIEPRVIGQELLYKALGAGGSAKAALASKPKK